MLSENASPLEMAWSLMAVVGVIVATAFLIEIWQSFRAVMAWIREGRLRMWGPRHKLALGFLCGVGMLLLVWIAFVTLGFNAMHNPPPATDERAEAALRGGIIIIVAEAALLGATVILATAWVAVGRPSLQPGVAPNSPAALLFLAVDAGREMGHTVANELQMPISILDSMLIENDLPLERRREIERAVSSLEHLAIHVRDLHETIKGLEQRR